MVFWLATNAFPYIAMPMHIMCTRPWLQNDAEQSKRRPDDVNLYSGTRNIVSHITNLSAHVSSSEPRRPPPTAHTPYTHTHTHIAIFRHSFACRRLHPNTLYLVMLHRHTITKFNGMSKCPGAQEKVCTIVKWRCHQLNWNVVFLHSRTISWRRQLSERTNENKQKWY